MAVSRIEIADLVEPAFRGGAVSRDGLLQAVRSAGGRDEVIDVLAQLPDRSFRELRELWPEIPHVPVEV